MNPKIGYLVYDSPSWDLDEVDEEPKFLTEKQFNCNRFYSYSKFKRIVYFEVEEE